jgi:hypothetical protein
MAMTRLSAWTGAVGVLMLACAASGQATKAASQPMSVSAPVAGSNVNTFTQTAANAGGSRNITTVTATTGGSGRAISTVAGDKMGFNRTGATPARASSSSYAYRPGSKPATGKFSNTPLGQALAQMSQPMIVVRHVVVDADGKEEVVGPVVIVEGPPAKDAAQPNAKAQAAAAPAPKPAPPPPAPAPALAQATAPPAPAPGTPAAKMRNAFSMGGCAPATLGTTTPQQ